MVAVVHSPMVVAATTTINGNAGGLRRDCTAHVNAECSANVTVYKPSTAARPCPLRRYGGVSLRAEVAGIIFDIV